MERTNKTVAATAGGGDPTPTSSRNPPSGTNESTGPDDHHVPRDYHKALFGVINQINALAGYGMKLQTSSDLDPVIRVWYRQLQQHRIPLDAYQEIVDAMVTARAAALRSGGKPPNMD